MRTECRTFRRKSPNDRIVASLREAANEDEVSSISSPMRLLNQAPEIASQRESLEGSVARSLEFLVNLVL